MKKQVLRTCVISKEKLPKNELIRIVKNKDNKVLIDLTGRVNGHGIYLKKDISIINKVRDNKLLDKLLEVSINNELYEELINIVK